MVVGISSVILPIATDRAVLKRDMPVNIGITVMLLFMLLDGRLSRVEAIILLVFFVAYLLLLVRSALKNREEAEETKVLTWFKSILFILLGAGAVIGGGQLVVNSSKTIAINLGMGETLVGLTVVAFGTSLPELVTSIVAAKKGDSGIAMGNVVGSCIFNILFILGITATIKPLTAGVEFFIDTGILIAVCLVMLLFAFTKKKTDRLEGAACVVIYAAYTAYIIMRAYGIWIF
jgi:cation:H+ antiporter